MPRDPEEDCVALLQVFSSEQVQYAGFVLTFTVAVFAEISLLQYAPHWFVWAAVAASVVGGVLSLESYLELTELVRLSVVEQPTSELGMNQLKSIWDFYICQMQATTRIGKISIFREHHSRFRIIYWSPLIGILLALLFLGLGLEGIRFFT